MPFGLELPSVDLPNPLDYVPSLPAMPSIPNPIDYLPSMPSLPSLPAMPSIPNPIDYLPTLPSLPELPSLPSMPEIPNPIDYLPSLPSIPNPIDLLPDFELPPDPLQPIIDDVTGRIQKGQDLHTAMTEGEANTTTPEQKAEKGQDLKAKYQQQAWKSLGIDEKTFDTMDPIKRNGLINAAYAKMYQKDPEVYKWAGMAAMASDKAGTGMMQTYMLEGAELVPGAGTVAGEVGAPGGKQVRDLLAIGNGGIFNDMMWQHMAFDQGGIKEIEKAAKEGSITPEQLEGWRKLASSKEELAKAKESGDPEAIKKAQAGIWSGNKTLLHAEQSYVQEAVYDKPGGKEAFEFLSGPLNVMGVTSPVPGGTKFGEYRDQHEGDHPGTSSVGNFDQRWGWIETNMLPEYQAFESDPSKMNAEMKKYTDREHKNQWDEKAWNPANDLLKKATGPLQSPFFGMFD